MFPGIFHGPACLECTIVTVLACPGHRFNISLELEFTDEYQRIALFTIIQDVCNFFASCTVALKKC